MAGLSNSRLVGAGGHGCSAAQHQARGCEPGCASLRLVSW
ncbi:hypothetical protein PSPO01_14922 [Paraphaeosphaeria sporulosa]